MEKKWKIFESCSCPNCGNSIEVLSECPEENDTEFEVTVMDQEDVRCIAQCGFISCTDVSEEGYAGIQEGNINELENS